MKKIIALLSAFLILNSQVYAAQPNQRVVVLKDPASATPISAVTLDDSPTSVTGTAVNVSGYERVGIYWSYDETENGGVSAALTLQVSPDGTNYFSAPFFDTAGGATPQTSESLTADGGYVAWFDNRIPFNYIRPVITCTGCDANDTNVNTVRFYYDRG